MKIKTIANEVHLSENSVRNLVHSLNLKGYIRIHEKNGHSSKYEPISLQQTFGMEREIKAMLKQNTSKSQAICKQNYEGTPNENYEGTPNENYEGTPNENYEGYVNKNDINKNDWNIIQWGNKNGELSDEGNKKFIPFFIPSEYPKKANEVFDICKKNNIDMQEDSAIRYLIDRDQKGWKKLNGKKIELQYIPYDLNNWNKREQYPDQRFKVSKIIHKLSDEEKRLLYEYVSIFEEVNSFYMGAEFVDRFIDKVFNLGKSKKGRIEFLNKVMQIQKNKKCVYQDGPHIADASTFTRHDEL